MTLPDVCNLFKHWTEVPPAYVSLAAIVTALAGAAKRSNEKMPRDLLMPGAVPPSAPLTPGAGEQGTMQDLIRMFPTGEIKAGG